TQGLYEKAEPLYLRALAIREKVHGPNHPSVALVLRNLGTLYKRAGRLDEAEKVKERARAIEAKHK
ncbi:MAG TPA: tetratricopeptide repeat protein, partial [bacterium]